METKSIIITNSKYTDIIRMSEIIYCKASGSYAEIMLNNQKRIIASKNLRWLEEKCCPDTFCRIHKSFIVNLQYASKVFHLENELLLSNGVKVPIAKSKKIQFWQKMTNLHL